ncbi:MAG: metal ABC transporter ATP-binding protein [bacterium]|nr:metal ABC transporter ATP-binding protein [bacterium]
MPPVLKVQDLRVAFGSDVVLNNVSFEVEKGEVLAIIGPNGAGKTVLFRALLGLLSYEGNIEWMKSAKIGYVPQKFFVAKDLPMTVLDFLCLKDASEAEMYEALGSVGLKGSEGSDKHHFEHHILNSRLGDLSGGQMQRVMIAYALMNHPDVLLFDEPTTGVDISGEETIYNLLGKLHREHGLTIILITHDFSTIYRYAEKVLCLNKEKVCFGAPKEALDPKVLEKLYGAQVGVYPHTHESHI